MNLGWYQRAMLTARTKRRVDQGAAETIKGATRSIDSLGDQGSDQGDENCAGVSGRQSHSKDS